MCTDFLVLKTQPSSKDCRNLREGRSILGPLNPSFACRIWWPQEDVEFPCYGLLPTHCLSFPPQLETFLSQRIVEMSEEADVLSVSQFQLAPPILQGQTREKVADSLSVIQDLIGRLTNLRMQHLFMILASPRSVGQAPCWEISGHSFGG